MMMDKDRRGRKLHQGGENNEGSSRAIVPWHGGALVQEHAALLFKCLHPSPPKSLRSPAELQCLAASQIVATAAAAATYGRIPEALLSVMSPIRAQLEPIGLLGQGGFGQVTLHRSRLDQRLIAVKQIKFASPCAPWAAPEELEQHHHKLLREVRALASLASSPFVVRYHSCWIEPDWAKLGRKLRVVEPGVQQQQQQQQQGRQGRQPRRRRHLPGRQGSFDVHTIRHHDGSPGSSGSSSSSSSNGGTSIGSSTSDATSSSSSISSSSSCCSSILDLNSGAAAQSRGMVGSTSITHCSAFTFHKDSNPSQQAVCEQAADARLHTAADRCAKGPGPVRHFCAAPLKSEACSNAPLSRSVSWSKMRGRPSCDKSSHSSSSHSCYSSLSSPSSGSCGQCHALLGQEQAEGCVGAVGGNPGRRARLSLPCYGGAAKGRGAPQRAPQANPKANTPCAAIKRWPYMLYITMDAVPGVTLDVWLAHRNASLHKVCNSGSSGSSAADGSSASDGSEGATDRDWRRPNRGDAIALGPTEQSIFMQILKGLDHVHAQGLVHRDLKPSNIFVSPLPASPDDPAGLPGVQVLLADFGLASISGMLSRSTSGGSSSSTGVLWGGHTHARARDPGRRAGDGDGVRDAGQGRSSSRSSSSSSSSQGGGADADSGGGEGKSNGVHSSSSSSSSSSAAESSASIPEGISPSDEVFLDRVSSASFHTRTTQIGTPSYCAPEQLSKQGSSSQYGPEVDMYPLGLILMELACPFSTGMERAEAMQRAQPSKRFRHSFPRAIYLPLVMLRKLPAESALTMRLLMEPGQRPSALQLLRVLARLWGVEDMHQAAGNLPAHGQPLACALPTPPLPHGGTAPTGVQRLLPWDLHHNCMRRDPQYPFSRALPPATRSRRTPRAAPPPCAAAASGAPHAPVCGQPTPAAQPPPTALALPAAVPASQPARQAPTAHGCRWPLGLCTSGAGGTAGAVDEVGSMAGAARGGAQCEGAGPAEARGAGGGVGLGPAPGPCALLVGAPLTTGRADVYVQTDEGEQMCGATGGLLLELQAKDEELSKLRERVAELEALVLRLA